MKKHYLFWVVIAMTSFCYAQTEVFINEIHYDNNGGDINEGVEIAGPAGTDLENWKLVFYRGNGTVYATMNLSGTIPNHENNRGARWFDKIGIQNDTDGIVLIDPLSNVIQFLSYEGSFTATEGIANGLTSTDIGVFESGSEALGNSLQLTGAGVYYSDFTWASSAIATSDLKNNNQTFTDVPYVLSSFTVPLLKYELGFGPSDENTFIVEGRNLSNDIVLNAPTNYEISETSGAGWTSEIQLSPTANVVDPTTIYVRLKSMLSVGTYNENVSVASIGALLKTVELSGKVTPVSTNSLVITGVYDGPLSGGTPKGIELYVINDIPDLSVYGLGSANNGGGTAGEEFIFSAVSATAGDYIYVSSSKDDFNAFFGFDPNYTDIVVNINGDDAIELFENGVVFDVFGDINTDGTGTSWEYLDGWAYRNTEGPNATFNANEWNYSGINALDGETTNATATNPFPLASYDSEVLSVTKNEIEGFALYPNPVTNGKLYMNSANSMTKHVQLFSIVGNKVYDNMVEAQEHIEISNLSKGLYMVKVIEQGKIATRKLIVN